MVVFGRAMSWLIRASHVGIAAALALSTGSVRSQHCNLDCQVQCGHPGSSAVSATRWSACFDICINRCLADQSPVAVRPDRFGGIALSLGDGYATIGRRATDAKDLNRRLTEHCQAHSKAPAQCRVVALYKNSCGALVDSSQRYVIAGNGTDSTYDTAAQAEAAALRECRRDGATDCGLLISGCAADRTAEEKADDALLAGAIITGLGAALRWGLGPPPGPARQKTWEEKLVEEHNANLPGPTNVDGQFVQVCSPDSQIGGATNITPGMAQAHWGNAHRLSNEMRADRNGELYRILERERGNVQLTVSLIDPSTLKPTIQIRKIDASQRCGRNYTESRYKVQEWLLRDKLN